MSLRPMLAAVLMLNLGAAGAETQVAVIDDPDGYTNVRKEPGKDSEVIGRVEKGEKFITTGGEDWWEVYTPGGVKGFMHKSRLKVLPGEALPRLVYSKKDLLRQAADSPEMDEIQVDYGGLVKGALEGPWPGLRAFYDLPTSVTLDGAGAEIHNAMQWEVFHVAGDRRFSAFLKSQDEAFRKRIAEDLRNPFVTYPVEKPDPYLKRHFPETWKVISGEGKATPEGR